MRMSRREFLKLASAVGVATALPLVTVEKAMAGNGDPRVIWLQGQSCSGCSVSLLNSVNLTTADDLLLNRINLEYHSTLIAAAGDLALADATGSHPSTHEINDLSQQWLGQGKMDLNADGVVNYIDFGRLKSQGYIFVVEGAIPTGSDGLFCHVGGEMTMLEAFDLFSADASQIISIGTCASYGGIPGAAPHVTGALSVQQTLNYLGRTKPVVNIPGCPAHPDWFVGTVIKLLAGERVQLDTSGRPADFFLNTVHINCPRRGTGDAHFPGDSGCLEDVGCRGKQTRADCPIRKWNNSGPGQSGVNWCVEGGSPCQGCTEPAFPDGMSPFYKEDD